MKPWMRKTLCTALLLTAVLSAFYLRAAGDRRQSALPVQRVFALVSTPAPAGGEAYRGQRDALRSEEYQALSALAREDEKAAALLQELIDRAEKELAVEAALAAMGQEKAVCALREEAAILCVQGQLSSRQAQTITTLCTRLTGVAAENVLILDECGYL